MPDLSSKRVIIPFEVYIYLSPHNLALPVERQAAWWNVFAAVNAVVDIRPM